MSVVKVSKNGDTVSVMELRALISKIDLLQERFVIAGLGFKTRSCMEIVRFKTKNALAELLANDPITHKVPPKLRAFSFIYGDFLKRRDLNAEDASVFVEAVDQARLLIQIGTPIVPQAGYFIYAATKKVESASKQTRLFG